MMKMKKALMGTMLAGAVVVGAGFGAGTFSDFTSKASSNGNKIETGNLLITSTGSETFSATNKAPGYSETKTFRINNEGSLAAKDLTADATVTVKDKDGNAVTDLAPYSEFKFSVGGHTVSLPGLEAAIEAAVASAPDLAAGGHYQAPVKVELTRAAGNEYQNLDVQVDVVVSAKAYE